MSEPTFSHRLEETGSNSKDTVQEYSMSSPVRYSSICCALGHQIQRLKKIERKLLLILHHISCQLFRSDIKFSQ